MGRECQIGERRASYLRRRSSCWRISDSILPLNIIAVRGRSPSTMIRLSADVDLAGDLDAERLEAEAQAVAVPGLVQFADVILELGLQGLDKALEPLFGVRGREGMGNLKVNLRHAGLLGAMRGLA